MVDDESAGSIYDAIGEIDGFRAVAAAWHQRAVTDEIVGHAFSHGFRDDHVERLATYLAESLGGPALYSDRYGNETDVVRKHSGNGPHSEMDDRAVACFDAALVDCGISASSDLYRALSQYWSWSTHGRMARFEDSANSVPAQLSVPKWSWDGLVTKGD